MFKVLFSNKEKAKNSVVKETIKKDSIKLSCKGSYKFEVVEIRTEEENEQHYKDFLSRCENSPNYILNYSYREPHRFVSKLVYDVTLNTDDDLYVSADSYLLNVKDEINILHTLEEEVAYESIIAKMEEGGGIMKDLERSISKNFKKQLKEGKIKALKESMKNEEFEIKLTISVEKD